MNDFQSFRISVPAAIEQRKAIKLKRDALKHRIDTIVERTTVDGHAGIVGAILNTTRKKEELLQLSRSLERVAALVEEYEALEKQDTFLEMFIASPSTIAAIAGDFSDDLDRFKFDS